jgi:hypothetical protein
MVNQNALFDVKRLGPIECPVCGATRNPDEDKAVACTADRDRDQYPRRPVGCLNTHQPEHADIPY